MSVDVVDLREFYSTPLGQFARKALADCFDEALTLSSDAEIVGLGYPIPLFEALSETHPRSVILMPARQGALPWPGTKNSKTALVDENELPIETASVDCVIVMHLLENALDPSLILDEIWRILVPEGKLVLVATNRRGLWARYEHTPFGNGRPFSKGQLGTLLRKAKLTPSHWGECLNFPPTRYKRMMHFFSLLDKVGHRLWPLFCGAFVVTATKRLYQGIPASSKVARPVKVPVLAPQGAGLPKTRRTKKAK